MIKYKIKDVAADFGMPAKEIMQIVEKFFEKPKSNSQVLEDDQLNVIFDYITQTNQIESLEVVFATAQAKKAEEPKAE
jgi:translation initiation factor IF-2